MSYIAPPEPIGANPSWSVAPSFVKQAPELNAGDVVVAHNLSVLGHYNGLARLRTVIGYTSNKFRTQTSTTVSHLMREPNLPEPTSALLAEKQGAILLPPKAVMEAIQVLASETVTATGAIDYDIGNAAFNTTSDTLLGSVPLESVNSGVLAKGNSSVPALSSTGSVGTTGGTSGDGFLTVTANTYDNTAGSLKVAVSYWVVPDNVNEIGNPPVN
jgi:hypothetical protein